MTIAILGRSLHTANYEKAFEHLNIPTITTLSISKLSGCDGLLLLDGGDITPAFFGQKNSVPKTSTQSWIFYKFRLWNML